MTAPVLAYKKFYIIKPAEGTNQIKNPIFSPPDLITGWGKNKPGSTIESTSEEQRHGAYCLKFTPDANTYNTVYYSGVTVENGLWYTFSADIKAPESYTDLRLSITNYSLLAPVYTEGSNQTIFAGTGEWQRVSVSFKAGESKSDYKVAITKPNLTITDPIYIDGVQFEQASAATTLIEGYMPGCRWESYARNSASIRSAQYRKGGEIVDLSDYCEIVQVTGLGHGDWNQILTKMTSGGDMYQTHTRKSRNFSIVVDFTGNSLSEIETNRKAVIDLIRPDLLTGQEMIVRYQGVDVNGDEATNPVDIVCVPLPATLVDTPDLPTYQRAVLNFSIPSGLLNGAYNEGKELDLYADFPAEFIVKRDPDGNWCEFNIVSGNYDPLITGLNDFVNCMAEGPDGKIYVGGEFTDAGGITDADYLARWNPVTEEWEKVVSGIYDTVQSMAFDANGNLYIGGRFTNLGSTSGDCIAKITNLSGLPVVHALGTGLSSACYSIAISPDGDVYAGGSFSSAGGVANTARIAKWDGASWSPVSTGLDGLYVLALAFAPNGDLYIGGTFTNAAYPYICKWDGSAFSAVGTAGDINGTVRTLVFDGAGFLYAGGDFTNAGGIANADYIAKWSGSKWESLGSGTNNVVYEIAVNSGKVYVSGSFTIAGGLTLTDRVAVWSNGAWQPFDIDLPGTANVYSILPASDGSLYIGGNFSTTSASENAETGIVALNLNVTSASANTYPFMQVRGPGTLKAITNYSTGKTIAFDGLTLNAGEWINLFFDPLNLQFYGGWTGRGNLMRYVVPGSDYGDFYLMPGSNLLSLFMTGSDSNSGAFMSWTPLFWGIDGALL